MQQRVPGRSLVKEPLAACRSALIAIAAFSGVINVLALTGAFFMLQIYDRVLPSRSIPTLVALALFAGILFLFLGILEVVRSRVFVRIGGYIDQRLSGPVFSATMKMPLRMARTGDGLQALRDLDQLRLFLSGGGPAALFDLPWLPVYLAICFVLHPLIGIAAAIGALVLVVFALVSEFSVRAPAAAAAEEAETRAALAEASRRNAEVLQVMGMAERLTGRWRDANARYAGAHMRASDLSGSLGAVSKVFRMALQAGILGVGAWLVIQQQATGGVIIAGAILSARALAPLETSIANWKGFLGARQSWHRLKRLLALFPARDEPLALSRPEKALVIEGISVAPPGARKLTVQDISLALKAGDGLGIIGPSASGKSTLARAIVGAWPASRGQVRLDGAALDQWSPAALGRHIGYLPQDVELFAGTVAENIARFEDGAAPERIIAAAQAAGAHAMILQLPEGYETQIGHEGTSLSAGQCQQVALARALYNDPFLVVLDEPNSNLDADGDKALTEAILGCRARGAIVIVVAHRPSAIDGVDILLAMANGKAQAFGPKQEVLARILRGGDRIAPVLKPVPGNAERSA